MGVTPDPTAAGRPAPGLTGPGQTAPAVGRTSPAIRVAALSFAADVGFGIAMPIALAHRARTGELPMTPWGFRAFAGGPFDRLDPGAFAALGWVLVGVSAAEAVAGVWLWRGERRGGLLGLALTPPMAALAGGYLLPLLLLQIPVRVALVAVGWRGLRRRGGPPAAALVGPSRD